MKHIVIIMSKSQTGFVKIEDHILISETEVEQLALQKYKNSIDDSEGKSFWADIEETIHN